MRPYGIEALRHRVEVGDRRDIRHRAKKRARQDAAAEARAERDELARNWTAECDCGRGKSTKARVCDRCRFLDGGVQTAELVHALRHCEPCSVPELAEHMGRSRQSVEKSLWDLRRTGRVSRAMGDGGLYLYRLDVPAEVAA